MGNISNIINSKSNLIFIWYKINSYISIYLLEVIFLNYSQPEAFLKKFSW